MYDKGNDALVKEDECCVRILSLQSGFEVPTSPFECVSCWISELFSPALTSSAELVPRRDMIWKVTEAFLRACVVCVSPRRRRVTWNNSEVSLRSPDRILQTGSSSRGTVSPSWVRVWKRVLEDMTWSLFKDG